MMRILFVLSMFCFFICCSDKRVELTDQEAVQLADAGAVEIYLLGQNVNAYHGLSQDANSYCGLSGLIRKIATIPNIKRIRYTTSHPCDMSEDLIAAHGDVEKLMPFLHLPIQSGSDSVLKRMNRKHTKSRYVSVVEKLRKARPGIGLSSDFIVGFPGETDEEFEDTMKLIGEIEFAQCFSFKYSRRPGTPAASMPNQVDEVVKEDRLAKLQQLILEHQLKFNQTFIGVTVPVLFDAAENTGKSKSDQIRGRSPHLQSVVISQQNPELINQIAEVTITRASPSCLFGELQI